MDSNYVMEYLPHRPPFLFVDRVVEMGENSICCAKVFPETEAIFEGHFPGNPIVPGVLIIEAIAQSAGILAFNMVDRRPDDGTTYMVCGVDKARFKRPVLPNDEIFIKAEVVSCKRKIWKVRGSAEVEGQLVASAELLIAEKEQE